MSPDIAAQIAARREVVGALKSMLLEALQLDLESDEIAEDSPLFGVGLGLDSIDALTLVVALEDRFGLQVPNDYLRLFRSVNTMADFLQTDREPADALVGEPA